MRIVNWWTIASLVKKIILLYSNNISLSFSFSTMNTMKIVFALVIYLTVSILQVKSQYVPQSLVIRNILKWRKEHDTYLTHICKHRWSRQIMMKVDTFLELSASTVAFISCRGRLTKVLAGATRGKTGSKSEAIGCWSTSELESFWSE